VQNEQVQTLEDLVERRLMLLYHPQLTRRCLVQLAETLRDEGRLANDPLHEVQRTTDRLREHFGKRLAE
jgi:DNA-directed RNA polymerase specialized sigma54-like protein